MARIFVSSTFKDLEECREKVKLNLKRMGHDDISMEYYVAEDKRPVDKCLEDVTSCDLYVGIFAWRYGYVPKGYDKSITELEYRKAVEIGKECLIFLLHEDASWPKKLIDMGKDAEKISVLRDELSKEKIVSFFKSADELVSLVGTAVYKWEAYRRNSFPKSSHVNKLFQVPSLPDHFVERPEVSEEVKRRLLDKSISRNGLALSAIHGLGGIGKSTLAVHVVRDKEIKQCFPDGIFWVTLGQNPNLLSLLNGLIQGFEEYNFHPTTVEDASNFLRAFLQDKSALLVIDDAWDSEHVMPFKVEGSNCQMLITTRDSLVAKAVGASVYPLNVMTEEQAVKLLSAKLRRKLSGQEKLDARHLAENVEYLPLAIELAAAQIEEGISISSLNNELETEFDRLKLLEIPGVEDLNEESRRNLSLKASFNLSLRRLKSNQLIAFCWLGILPEDILINPIMATTLWGLNNHREALEILIILKSKSLLLPGTSTYRELPTFRLHDLLHDRAQNLITTSRKSISGKGDIPGLGLKIPEAHEKLIEKYHSKLENNQWSSLEDDGYILNNLVWHFEMANMIEKIHNLLKEETSDCQNAWYNKMEAIGRTSSFIEDIATAWRLVEKISETCYIDRNIVPTLGLEIRYALMNSSINSLSSNLPLELLLKLLESKIWTEIQVLTYAHKEPHLIKKMEKLASIGLAIKSKHLKEETLRRLLETAYEAQNIGFKSKIPITSLSFFDNMEKEDVLKHFFDFAINLHTRESRLTGSISDITVPKAEILSFIVSEMNNNENEELLLDVLNFAADIPKMNILRKILLIVVNKLSLKNNQELFYKTLFCASMIGSSSERNQAIIYCFSMKTKDNSALLARALEFVKRIENPLDRVEAITLLADNMVEEQKKEILKDLISFVEMTRENSKKLKALSRVIVLMNTDEKKRRLTYLLDEIEEHISEREVNYQYQSDINNFLEEIKMYFSIACVTYGEKKGLEMAITKVKSLRNKTVKIEALLTIASEIDGIEREKILKLALSNIEKYNEYDKRKLLSFLVSIIKVEEKEMIKKVFECVSKIQDDEYRAKTFLPIENKLKLEEELSFSKDKSIHKQESQSSSYYSKANIYQDFLSSSEMSISLIKQELARLLETSDEFDRAEKLSVITSKLTYSRNAKYIEVVEQLFDIAANIQDETARKKSLSSLTLNLECISLKNFYPLWSKSLHLLALRTRKDLLIDLEALIPLIYIYGGEVSLLETSKAIKDVSRWWS